jgi:hypothetical protein
MKTLLSYILQHMNVLLSIDDELAKLLERVAPAKSRKRSIFIRAALRKAILEAEEVRTREAYARLPDTRDDVPFDPSAWSEEAWVEGVEGVEGPERAATLRTARKRSKAKTVVGKRKPSLSVHSRATSR